MKRLHARTHARARRPHEAEESRAFARPSAPTHADARATDAPPRRARETTRHEFIHRFPSSTMLGGGPFKLPNADPTADARARAKRDAIARVKSWVESRLPREHLDARDCVVDVSEIQCGDPECAPIDTVIRIIYRDACGTAFGIPCEAEEVEVGDVESQMPPAAVVADWANGTPTAWPPEPEPQEPGPVPTDALRFEVGTRVRCRVGPGEDGWAAGAVVAHWYRGSAWPTGQYAPYQVQLDRKDMGSGLIFAPYDDDACIRAE